MIGGDSNFAKTICSICYEDLKPIVEDLQSISICGHVFHELCLQQWFEYCSSSTKKYSCPVCKQKCVVKNAGRLYFQSVGDQCCSPAKKPVAVDREENAEVLRVEVKRLEVKVSGLTSAMESQGKELRDVSRELSLCKEQNKKEMTLKSEALREKAFIQKKLDSKSEELSQCKSECSRLEQRNLALAKELAVLKLVSDLELEQHEIVKLASLGNGSKTQDTIDNLSRSLASHKKNYKELMAKCNLLGRGEAHLQKKLEKAKEKIIKLKMRIQELETANEAKDNEVLRALKASSKKRSPKKVILNADDHIDASIAKRSMAENQVEQSFVPVNRNNIDLSETSPAKETENIFSVSFIGSHHAKDAEPVALEKETRDFIIIEDDIPQSPVHVHKLSSFDLRHENGENTTKAAVPSTSEAVSNINPVATVSRPVNIARLSELKTCLSNDRSAAFDADPKPMFNIRRESPSPLPRSDQGNVCFSGGLLGPDGTKWHLGKWCKRGKMNGSATTAHGSTANSGDLISVGADGRGGRIKVMRSSMDRFSSDDKENSVFTKKPKTAPKTSNSQSQGCLQIEHFFGKASH